MKHILIVAFAFAILSCKSTEPTATTTDGAFFGEEFKVETTTSIQNAIKDLSASDTLNIQLAGMVESVCKKKGCWTNIATKENPDESFFVKFKDYGFFLPLDCEGQDVVMQGKAYIETTPVDELRHYAEDEGKSEEEIAAITEPKAEYKFMASGVFLKNKEAQ
jgi:hypothetical protein